MLDSLQRSSLLKCLSNFRGAANHIKWILVVNVFIGRHFPAKLIRIHVMRKLRHRDAREPRFKHIPIEHVDLHAAATHACMLLKCWLKYATSKIHTRQLEFIQRLCVKIRIDVWRADKFKGPGSAATF